MSEINTAEHIIELIQSMAEMKQEVHGIGKVVKKIEDMDKRLGKVESVLRDKKIITEHHKSIFNFFSKNWKFLTSLGFGVLLIIGAVDIALKVPSTDQQQEIHRLQTQVSQIRHEV